MFSLKCFICERLFHACRMRRDLLGDACIKQAKIEVSNRCDDATCDDGRRSGVSRCRFKYEQAAWCQLNGELSAGSSAPQAETTRLRT